MSDIISGGFAFRYIQHSQQIYGLVDTSGNPVKGNGFSDLCTEYSAVSTFASSSVKGTDPLTCNSSYDPALPKACGGSTPVGPTIKITVTNEVSPVHLKWVNNWSINTRFIS